MIRADKNRWVESNKILFFLVMILTLIVGGLGVYFLKNPEAFQTDFKKMIFPLFSLWLTLVIMENNKIKIRHYRYQLLLKKQAQYCSIVIQHVYHGRREDAIKIFNDFVIKELPTAIFVLGYMAAFDSGKLISETKNDEA